MDSIVEIDETDVKILRELIRDARRTLTDIAKQCGLSSTAVLNRVKRLKAKGVITGAVLFSDMSLSGHLYPASIEISLKPSQVTQVTKLIAEKVNLVMFSRSVGKENLFLFVVAKSIQEIDDLKQSIKGQPGIRGINVSFWGTPNFNFENINLQPTRA
jgi:Lrp/AsnC family leucine-responsive transcriptional regulator